MNVPTLHVEAADFVFEITAEATNALTKRLNASGVEHPHVVASLALAGLAMRLSPEEASRLAASEDAAAAVEAFTPPENPIELARREAEASGKLVHFRRSRTFWETRPTPSG
jgi:hypothetical protein